MNQPFSRNWIVEAVSHVASVTFQLHRSRYIISQSSFQPS